MVLSLIAPPQIIKGSIILESFLPGLWKQYDPVSIVGDLTEFQQNLFDQSYSRAIFDQQKCPINGHFIEEMFVNTENLQISDILMKVNCGGKVGWIHLLGEPYYFASFFESNPIE